MAGPGHLQQLLQLPEIPRVLECYDIAIWQGSSPTAAKIVFLDGIPVKSKYRHYRLAERAEGNNDFAMLQEVLQRRLMQGDYPDVFVIDGGKGQINVALKALKAAGLGIPVVGIAKKNVGRQKEERLIFMGHQQTFETYLLKNHRGLARLLAHLRDEAHRFARRLHHKHELKRLIPSS